MDPKNIRKVTISVELADGPFERTFAPNYRIQDDGLVFVRSGVCVDEHSGTFETETFYDTLDDFQNALFDHLIANVQKERPHSLDLDIHESRNVLAEMKEWCEDICKASWSIGVQGMHCSANFAAEDEALGFKLAFPDHLAK